MINAARSDDYIALLYGDAPRDLQLPATPIAPSDVLQMLVDCAAENGAIARVSWLVVEQGEIIGLCSITDPPHDGVVEIVQRRTEPEESRRRRKSDQRDHRMGKVGATGASHRR